MAFCLSAFTLSAQELAVDVEFSGSLGMDKMQGSQYGAQLKGVAGVQWGGLMVGIGTGLNYDSVLAGRWYSTTDGSETFVYQTEYLLPVFARIKYTFRNVNLMPYVLVDGGYSFNVGGQKAHNYVIPIKDGEACGMPLNYEGRARGLYMEPQVGVHLTDRLYLGLGFMMQAYTQYAVAVTGTLLATDSNYGSQTHVQDMTKDNYFNALSIHIGLNF